MSPKTQTLEKKDSKFQELFLHELKDIYWAETHLAKTLPKMKDKATSEKLSNAIGAHIKETEKQIERLEEVFEMLDEEAESVTCEAMKGLIKEAEEILDDTESDTMVRDAGIIIASQKVEHYEIASYGSLVHLCKKMGLSDCANLLEKTLEEEKKADKKLTEIAEKEVNEKAMQE
ncbi:MAG: ferritin-like domain-containing protein [Balneolaceae bacterium]